MADLLVALALLTFAGVVGLVAMVIALCGISGFGSGAQSQEEG